MADLNEVGIILRDLLNQFSPPVNLNVLLRGYRIQEGTEVPWEKYGYSDPATFLRQNFANQLTVHETSERAGVYLVTFNQQLGPASSAGNGAGEHPTSVGRPASVVPQTSVSTPTTNSYLDAFRRTRSTTGGSRSLPVPVQFRTYLARLLKGYPNGISAKSFVEVFLAKSGAPLNYTMYGYPGHLSMFRDLDDVFKLETARDGSHILYPVNPFDQLEASKATGRVTSASTEDNASATNSSPLHRKLPADSRPTAGVLSVTEEPKRHSVKEEPTDALNGDVFRRHTACMPRNSTPAVVATDRRLEPAEGGTRNRNTPRPQQSPEEKYGAVLKEPTSYGDLFIVELGKHMLVPTACLAALADLTSDQVLEVLAEGGLDLQDIKFLSAGVPDHKALRVELARAGCPFIIKADGSIADVISLVPMEMCSVVLRALVGVPEAVLPLVN
ncbi:hypothetical protein BIW11_06493 [Tropilaelaps mercedesae]|uniref:HTH OST-type domain-containing protein n=1 Tax=Tropilaelaps mercedesae TaxID=418985 RepID=A0A1V9XXR2_9ACAR|nr:hypothetical protein BIW11_06493 [Tropilaelaps mercedesae]